MATVAAPPSALGRLLIIHDQHPCKPPKMFAFPFMKYESATSSDAEEEDISGDLRSAARFPLLEVSSSRIFPASRVPRMAASSGRSSLYFSCKPSSEHEFDCEHERVFGCYIAREALHDEELWMAALLRAECLWEEHSDARHIETYKRQFAEQEFNSLKRRCNRQQPQKCICIVAKKKAEDVNKNALVLGTLDLNIWPLLSRQPFPAESTKTRFLSNVYRADQRRFTYVANLCVSKHARRQGIATNMLLLAIEAATLYGSKQVFIHVDKDNIAARKLYDQIGFQMVENYIPRVLLEGPFLLCLKI